MNQAACDVKAESKEPKDDQDDYEGIEHIVGGCSLFATGDGYACKTFMGALLLIKSTGHPVAAHSARDLRDGDTPMPRLPSSFAAALPIRSGVARDARFIRIAARSNPPYDGPV